jgi:5-methylcytosine-specific restriction endonuclease McrA
MAAPRIYDTARWKRLRAQYLARHPLCVDCQRAGRVTPASHVDHIETVEQKPELAWSWSNLAGLCASCHAFKTSTSDRGFGRPAGKRRVKGCGLDGFPLDPAHPWFGGGGTRKSFPTALRPYHRPPPF